MLDIYKIVNRTNVEGPNARFCIWVQGCHKHCNGCYAKDTWTFGIGKKYSVEKLFEMINSDETLEGVTFLGGEPFEQAHELSELAKLVKNKGLSVLCFTGYTYEELLAKNDKSVTLLLDNVDLLIDGGYQEDKFDLTRPWVGSSNQRYIFLTDLYKEEDLKQYKNKIEARIREDGRLDINGMGDFKQFEKLFIYN